jgi:hypothetical protein
MSDSHSQIAEDAGRAEWCREQELIGNVVSGYYAEAYNGRRNVSEKPVIVFPSVPREIVPHEHGLGRWWGFIVWPLTACMLYMILAPIFVWVCLALR